MVNHLPNTDVFIKRVNKEEFNRLRPQDIIDDKNLDLVRAVDELIGAVLPRDIKGLNILLKPNLLKSKDPLCITSWQLMATVAVLLKKRDAKVTVGDSSAFGNAIQVLKAAGILDFFSKIGIACTGLSVPQKIGLPCGLDISISKKALEADIIFNLPRLKAHCQMGLTGAVKNLYGVVPGFRKALYHLLYGKESSLFARMIIEIGQRLPPTVNLMDATLCMHENGPSGGSPIWLGTVASSQSAHALDTTFYTALGATPERIPIWKESQRMGIPCAFYQNIRFPWLSMEEIEETSDFRLPEELDPIIFSPTRFIKGRVRSLLKGLAIGP